MSRKHHLDLLFGDIPCIGRRTFMTAAVAFAVAGTASGASIGLKIGINGNGGLQNAATGALLPTDIAGAPAYAQANWNVLGRFGNGINPTNSSGSPTTVVVNWDCTGSWSQAGGGTPTAQGSPDGNLMNAYLDSNGSGNNTLGNPVDGYGGTNNNCKPWMYITGLSSWVASEGVPSYDVVVYSDGDATAGRGGEYWLQSATGPWSQAGSGMTLGPDITTHTFLCDRANFVSTLAYAQVPLTVIGTSANLGGWLSQRGNFQGNYMVFTSVTNDSFLLRKNQFNTRVPINAVQIVPRGAPLPAMIDPLPASPAVYAGGKEVLRAQVAGVLPFTYQWQKNSANLTDGGNIFGSSTATLIISNVSALDVASYSLVVTNPSGVITSSLASLSIATPVANSYPAQIATDGPVAYWRFNETADPSTFYTPAYDYMGGANGTYQSSAQNGFNGIVGPQPTDFPGFETGNAALQSGFNVAHSWVTVPPLNLNTNSVTLTAWIYPTAVQAANTGILVNRGSGIDTCGLIFGPAGNLGYIWNANGATFNWSYGSPGYPYPMVPPNNAWSFVALVVSPNGASNSAILYLCNAGGQFSVTNTFVHTNETWGALTCIGDDPSDLTNPRNRAFAGSIDEVAVFNKSLPASEILNLYKKGLQIAAIPPVISIQPQSAALFEGRTAKFSIKASGEAPLTYQWRKDGANLSDVGNILGSGTPNLTVSSATIANDAGNYDIVVTNIVGSITSSVANLTLVVSNSAVKPYEARVRTFNPVSYWRLGETNGSPFSYDYWGGNILANTSVTFDVPGPIPPDFIGMESTNTGGQYDGISSYNASTVSLLNNRAQFSVIGWFNTGGTIGQRVGLFGQNDVVEFGFHGLGADGAAQLGVFTPRGSAFLNQSTNVIPGVWYLIAAIATGSEVDLYLASTNGAGGIKVLQSITTHAATTNYGVSAFPFRIGGGGVLDATGNYFTGLIDEVAVFDRALSLDELSALFGSALSGSDLPPAIAVDPSSRTLYAGRSTTFTVSALGTSPKYQWRTNGVPINNGGNVSGAKTPSLTITNVSVANAAVYDVVITNFVGSITSAPATLTVIPLPPGSYQAAVVNANPLAYYRLNEMDDPSSGAVAAKDYVGGHDGLYAGATLAGFNGILGPVPPLFKFESTNTAISVSAIPSSYVTSPFGSLSTNTVTMTMWVMPTGTFDAFAGLLVNRNSGVAGGFGYTGGNLGYTWNGNNAATYNATYGNADGRSDLIPPLNEWSFVALVVSPTNAILYMINPITGMQSATNVLAHTSDVFGNNWQIGRDNNANLNDGTRNFVGQIDEVAVFGYSLSQAQILSLYSAGAPLPVSLSIVPSGTNVIVTWPQGTLLQASDPSGPWTTNSATSPYTNAALGLKYDKVIVR